MIPNLMVAFVTGAAGFIGSNLVDRLLENGWRVRGYDNLATGRLDFVKQARSFPQFEFVNADLLDTKTLTESIHGAEIVFHLAANADVRFGLKHPTKDLEQNIVGTSNVLEAMRRTHVRRIVFASTGSIYGNTTSIPTPEDVAFPVQTSLYGASKLAAEGLISAYVEGFGFEAAIFRLVSSLGERYSHGHVFDFYAQLRKDPSKLQVLGDGTQRKSYIYVQDLIDAFLLVQQLWPSKLSILNVGTDEFCSVGDSIRWITERLSVSPELIYAGGNRGWVGDNPFIFLDCRRLMSLGWRPSIAIRSAVERTVDYLEANQWLFNSVPA